MDYRGMNARLADSMKWNNTSGFSVCTSVPLPFDPERWEHNGIYFQTLVNISCTTMHWNKHANKRIITAFFFLYKVLYHAKSQDRQLKTKGRNLFLHPWITLHLTEHMREREERWKMRRMRGEERRKEKRKEEVGWSAIKNESASWVQFRSSHRRWSDLYVQQ